MSDDTRTQTPVGAPIFWTNAADFKTLANRWITAYMNLGELLEQLERDRKEIMELMRKSLEKTKA